MLVPFAFFFSRAIRRLHLSTLPEASSSQAGHSASWLGVGWVPVHASRRAALGASSFRRAVSK